MGNVLEIRELQRVREELRRSNRKVVFTNGVFDIIHRGHVDYLTRARALGDVLCVAINSDSSVRRIKGDKRPIVAENDRAFVVGSLKAVDYVTIFQEDTPIEVIKALVPDVLVKGADWNIDAIVGKDVVENAGGLVATIEFVPARSSTNIIERILERYSTAK